MRTNRVLSFKLNSKCLSKQTPADASVYSSDNRKELLHQRPAKKRIFKMGNTEGVVTAVYI